MVAIVISQNDSSGTNYEGKMIKACYSSHKTWGFSLVFMVVKKDKLVDILLIILPIVWQSVYVSLIANFG